MAFIMPRSSTRILETRWGAERPQIRLFLPRTTLHQSLLAAKVLWTRVFLISRSRPTLKIQLFFLAILEAVQASQRMGTAVRARYRTGASKFSTRLLRI